MTTKRRALGRGLSSLIPEAPPVPAPAVAGKAGPGVTEVDIDRIRPGGHQPRTRFEDSAVRELAASIARSGVIQPIIVVREGKDYVLVAGERRWRAAQRAGLMRIPVIVREIDQEQRLEIALIDAIDQVRIDFDEFSAA